MHTFKKIFVAIDFSTTADEALRQAHHRALSSHAKLAVCHIIPNELRTNILLPHITRIAALKFPLETAVAARAVTERVAEITGRTEEGFDLIVDDGNPQATILSHAEKWKADLVVMGSHGQTSAAEILLGSVTNSVLRHAHCPVLIVRSGKYLNRIVAGTDFSDSALPAITAAAEECERTGAKLTVVHSLDLVWAAASYPAMAFGGAPFNISAEHIQELTDITIKQLEETLRKSHVTAEARVTTGSAGEALIELASEMKAMLIVVGTTGRSGLTRALLGSVAETVAKGAPCSVLTVRKHPKS